MAASVSPRFSWLTPEVESFSADLLQTGRCNLVCVDDYANCGWFLLFILSLLRVDATLSDGCRI